MDYFHITAPQKFINEIKKILTYYDYRFDLEECTSDKIIKHLKTGDREYDSIEEFLLKGIFYGKKKTLHHYRIDNNSDSVVNFDINPLNIIENNAILLHLMEHKIFREFLRRVYNYGTFIRFSENKVQRLYWNPPFNAGIPLTAKEKDPVYELIFLMHDYGHFLLPDLVFTGKLTDEKAKKIYVNWRLLGESITIVLNEMLVVDFLKDKDEFKESLKIGYDKPYSLYQILRKDNLKEIFWASYLYFCKQDKSGFEKLLDLSTIDNNRVWDEFNTRYVPVSVRGREWTETNFERLKDVVMIILSGGKQLINLRMNYK